MLTFVLSWVPLLAGLLLAIIRINRLWLAIPLIVISYFLVVILVVTIPPLSQMTTSGVGDPEQVAGAISESFVTAMLRAIIDIPIIITVWFRLRKRRQS